MTQHCSARVAVSFFRGKWGAAWRIPLSRVKRRSIDDAMTRQQAEAGARALGGEERLEQTFFQLGRYADARVADADLEKAARRGEFFGFEKSSIEIDAIGANSQTSAVPHRLQRVQARVQETLLQFGEIAGDVYVVGDFRRDAGRPAGHRRCRRIRRKRCCA